MNKMKETNKEEKIKVPFGLHIVGFILYLIFLIGINLNYFIFQKGFKTWVFGLLFLYFAFKGASDAYRENITKKDKGNPVVSYIFYFMIWIIASCLFAVLFASYGWVEKVVHAIDFIIMGVALWGVYSLTQNKFSKSKTYAYIIGLLSLFVLIGAYNYTFYILMDIPGQVEFEELYPDFEIYEDEFIAIKYPEYVTPAEPTQDFIYKVFKTKKESENDLFEDNLIIIFADSEGAKLDELTTLSLQGMEENNLKILSQEETLLLDNSAKKIVYQYDYDIGTTPYKIKVLMINTLVDGIFVSLQYTAEENSYEKYLLDMNKMIETFRVY